MFSLDPDQSKKLAAWCEEQTARALERQRARMSPAEFSMLTVGGKAPYAGAIGGELTYSFTPTSLGTVVKVTNGLTNETLDLTDYDSW